MTAPGGGRAVGRIEVCPRCRQHVLWIARCYHCGYEGEGVAYVPLEHVVATAVLYLTETLARNHPLHADLYHHAALNLKAVLESGIAIESVRELLP